MGVFNGGFVMSEIQQQHGKVQRLHCDVVGSAPDKYVFCVALSEACREIAWSLLDKIKPFL